jgi:hypothetical protein
MYSLNLNIDYYEDALYYNCSMDMDAVGYIGFTSYLHPSPIIIYDKPSNGL